MAATAYSHPASRASHLNQYHLSHPRHEQEKQKLQTHVSYHYSSHTQRTNQPSPIPYPSSSPSSSSVNRSEPMPEDLQEYSLPMPVAHHRTPPSHSRSPPSPAHLPSSPTTYPSKRTFSPPVNSRYHPTERDNTYPQSLFPYPQRVQPQHHRRQYPYQQQQQQASEAVLHQQRNQQQMLATAAEQYYHQQSRRTSAAPSMTSSPSFSASSVPSPRTPPRSLTSTHSFPTHPTNRNVDAPKNNGENGINFDERPLERPSSSIRSRSLSSSCSMSIDEGAPRSSSPSSFYLATDEETFKKDSDTSIPKLACPDQRCRKLHYTQQDLQRHVRNHNRSSERYICSMPGCCVVLSSKQTLNAHLRLCKEKASGGVHACPETGCNSSYTTSDNLLRHRIKHQRGLVGLKYPCTWPGCGKVLATPKSRKDHLQIHAERNAGITLYCPVEGCKKSFGTHRCLRAHELRCRQVKSGERLPCPVEGCNATFGSTDYVRRHVLDHEKGLIGVEFRCDFEDCQAVLANPLTLQRHKQLHEEQTLGFEWRCLVETCGKLYSGSKQLTDHQGRIHKDLGPGHKFPCPYKKCEDMFDCQRSAYKHLPCLKVIQTDKFTMLERQQQQQQEMEEEGTQQKPSHSTTCPFDDCTILIPDEKLLDGHIFMHNALTTRPPYPCFEEECSSFFDTKSGILAHALTHKK